jgi:hypothetical protein
VALTVAGDYLFSRLRNLRMSCAAQLVALPKRGWLIGFFDT